MFPGLNAFIIMFIYMALFAIVGVFTFREDDPSDFGNLTLALATMFVAGISSSLLLYHLCCCYVYLCTIFVVALPCLLLVHCCTPIDPRTHAHSHRERAAALITWLYTLIL